MAFEEGTLVVQCGKCRIWHKIRDHLHLFHDIKGEVFTRWGSGCGGRAVELLVCGGGGLSHRCLDWTLTHLLHTRLPVPRLVLPFLCGTKRILTTPLPRSPPDPLSYCMHSAPPGMHSASVLVPIPCERTSLRCHVRLPFLPASYHSTLMYLCGTGACPFPMRTSPRACVCPWSPSTGIRRRARCRVKLVTLPDAGPKTLQPLPAA